MGLKLREYIDFRNGFKGSGRWSQAKLARAAGISDKHLSQIVTGRVFLTPAIAVLMEQATDGDLNAIELMNLNTKYSVGVERRKLLAPECSPELLDGHSRGTLDAG